MLAKIRYLLGRSTGPFFWVGEIAGFLFSVVTMITR